MSDYETALIAAIGRIVGALENISTSLDDVANAIEYKSMPDMEQLGNAIVAAARLINKD